MHAIRAAARYSRAIHSTAELLGKLKIDAMFVGGIARSAWLGSEVSGGAVDVLALMAPQQKQQVAMMAANRGFRVEREELDATEEFDLIPLHFLGDEGEVQVHVLLASNALYGRMVAVGRPATLDERTIKVPRPEDLALLFLLAEDEEAVRRLTALPEFDLGAFRERLTSIGLAAHA